MSGLRRGEIAGLRWSDIDLDAGTLAIAHANAETTARIYAHSQDDALAACAVTLGEVVR